MLLSDLAYYLRISNHLAGNLDIRSALRSVKSEIDQIISIDHLDVCLIDKDNMCNTTYEVGLKTSWSSTHSLINVSPVRDILTGNTDTLLTGNALADERYVYPGSMSGPIKRHKLRSRINVAMKVLGRTIGSLNCSSTKLDFYDDRNVKQVRALADILAPYFFALRANEKAKQEAVIRAEIQAREEGLRLGALSLTDALEDERQRIGMDLHDQTLADLTRIARDIRPGLTQLQHDRIQRRIQNTIQGLRDIIDASIPSLLELFGLYHALQTHLERAINGENGTVYEITDETDGAIDALPEAMRIPVFRICQEAINNAVLHADANTITVTAKWDKDKRIVMKIADDGSFSTAPHKPHGGLTHMRTRARLIGAEFKLDTTKGTHISLRLPKIPTNARGDKP